jgi:hypothetical protein
VEDVVPVDVLEEGLLLDLLRVDFGRSQSPVGVARKELWEAHSMNNDRYGRHFTTNLLKDGDRVAGHVDRVQRLVLEDGVEDLVLVVAAERRLPE